MFYTYRQIYFCSTHFRCIVVNLWYGKSKLSRYICLSIQCLMCCFYSTHTHTLQTLTSLLWHMNFRAKKNKQNTTQTVKQSKQKPSLQYFVMCKRSFACLCEQFECKKIQKCMQFVLKNAYY